MDIPITEGLDLSARPTEARPIGSIAVPLYFTAYGDKYVRYAPNKYKIMTKEGEQEVTKSSDELMDALMSGTEIQESDYRAGMEV